MRIGLNMAYSGMVEMGRKEERRTMDKARYGKDSAKGHYRVFPGGTTNRNSRLVLG